MYLAPGSMVRVRCNCSHHTESARSRKRYLHMPSLPPPRCNRPRCRNSARAGSIYCVDHAPASLLAPSRDGLHMYKGSAWQVARATQLSRYPLCAACQLEGRTVAADTVDHVWPWRSLSPDAFVRNRLQSLCGPCHARKTALEGRGICREYRPGGAQDWCLADWHTQCHQGT